MRKYEVMLILPPEADEKVVQGAIDRISQVLEQGGGKVGSVSKWGKRRLAFEIKRYSEGFYLVIECESDPAAVKELDRVLTLADDVVRFKVVVRAAA